MEPEHKLRKDPYEVFVVRTDGSAPRLLTTPKNGITTPQWSHDGDTIVFCDLEKDKSSIEIIKADGTGKVHLTNPKLNASNPKWSADGKEIAFTAPIHGKLQVHLMNADGSQLRALTRDSKLACSNITWVPNTRLGSYCFAVDRLLSWVQDLEPPSTVDTICFRQRTRLALPAR